MTKTIGRPKKFKKDEVLTLAMNHFWVNGYHNSSLDELLKTMGIKKSSFYHTFKNKEELFSQSLDLYMQDRVKMIQEIRKEKGAKNALLEFINISIQYLSGTNNKKGCLLSNSGRECYERHEALSNQVSNLLNFFIDFITELVEEAKNKKEIKNPLDSRTIAIRYMSIRNGLVVMIQAGAKKEITNNSLEFIKELLK